jgi:hypothetical protein
VCACAKRNITAVAAVALAGVFLTAVPAGADNATGCPDLLVPHSTVAGYSVGETACSVTATSSFADAAGHSWQRVDVALSGTAAGYSDPVTVGDTRKDVTDVPDVLYPQFGITGWTPALGTYTGGGDGQGAGISVLFPTAVAQWTGRVVVLVHGQANNTPLGQLAPWPPGDVVPQDTFDNLYADEFVNAGYAVIYTRRPAASGVPTRLANGMTLDESVNDNITMLRDFLLSGERLLASRLGRAPSLVLWYGHSAGVIAGRLFNYSGLNDRPGGGHYVDGFLSDDSGGGLPLPLTMPEGQVLGVHDGHVTYPPNAFLPARNRDQMVPELTFAHALYLDHHAWLPDITYLTLKQLGEQLYEREGLGNSTVLYVVGGVSHIPNSTGSPAHTLDMGGLIQAAIPVLGDWVTRGTPPPPGGLVLLPPIACPTGYRYPWPAPGGAAQQTGFAPYDGTTPEPVNSQGALVDVDGDGVRDVMPTISQAWQRLGLVRRGQPVTRDAYVSCVRRAAEALRDKRLLSVHMTIWYERQAVTYPDLPW